ncbi:MAG: alanine racemase [Parasphingorhabdus sp.]|jgi:alanine racemase
MTYRVRACLDLNAVQHNIDCIRRKSPNTKLVAVIKANAYGHGLGSIATTLAGMVDEFAVASTEEAVELRQIGVAEPIWILSDFSPSSDLEVLGPFDLQPVIHSADQIDALEHLNTPVTAHLKIDSGMGRLGFRVDELKSALERLSTLRHVNIGVLLSHLACADDSVHPATKLQTTCFDQLTNHLNYDRSLANSAGVFAHPETHFDVVRSGIAIFGVSPLMAKCGKDLGLKPVMTLISKVLSVKKLFKGQSVGYGANFTCAKDTTMAIVSCGYGDGYPRHAKNGTPVLVRDQIAPLIGTISMDTLSIDVSEIEGVVPGDPVTLWGRGLPIENVARQSDTIAYELLCGLSNRVRFEELTDG